MAQTKQKLLEKKKNNGSYCVEIRLQTSLAFSSLWFIPHYSRPGNVIARLNTWCSLAMLKTELCFYDKAASKFGKTLLSLIIHDFDCAFSFLICYLYGLFHWVAWCGY